jgi:hypothetical protein
MRKQRITTVGLATVAALLLFSGTAFAHYCTNVSKNAEAGSAGTVFLDATAGEVDITKSDVRLNKQGQVTGGFYDLLVDVNSDGTGDFTMRSIYAHAGLPAGALLAAGCEQATETYVPFFEETCA